MSRGTIHRTVRIEDELWLPAKAKAETEGRNLSDVIRDALRGYVNAESVRAQAWQEGWNAGWDDAREDWGKTPNPHAQ